MLGAPSRLGFQSTVAPVVIFILPLLVTNHLLAASISEWTLTPFVFLCLLRAKNVGSPNIQLRASLQDIICQFFLRMGPIWMVVWSYGIRNGKRLLLVSFAFSLSNKSLLMRFSTFLNWVCISERLHSFLCRLSLRVHNCFLKLVSSVIFDGSVVIGCELYPFCSFLGEMKPFEVECVCHLIEHIKYSPGDLQSWKKSFCPENCCWSLRSPQWI